VLAVPPSHPWAARGVVRLRDVIGHPSSCARRASGTRKAMEKTVRSARVDTQRLRVVLEISSNEAVRQAVKAGAGIAVISQRAVQDDIRCGLLAGLRFQGTRLVRDVFLVTHRTDLTPRWAMRSRSSFVLPRHLSEGSETCRSEWPGPRRDGLGPSQWTKTFDD